jgi:aryl-alcohol dehydrogenase-like predicted oxidoreductase
VPTACSSQRREAIRPGDGTWTPSSDPEHLIKRAAGKSTRRLGVDAISVYQFPRPDPAEPYADSVGAICDLPAGGVMFMAGHSDADVAHIDEVPSRQYP